MGRLLFRLGSLTARHAVVTLVAWALLAIAIVGLVHIYGAKTNNNLSLPGTDSQRAFDVLAEKFPPQENGVNPFVFHVDEGALTDPENAAALDATYRAIKHAPHVYSVANPVGTEEQAADLLSSDGRTGFMPVVLDVNSGFITERLAQATLDATAPAEKAGIQVAVGGSIGGALSAPDTKASEVIGNVAAMVILALVFGSAVAMGTPIVTAIFALSVAISAIGLLGHVVGIPSVGPTIATMIGLGVGIDYALFLVTKHKDQLATGMDPRASVAHATASSGSAIVFAGGTVVIALLSLGVAGIPLVSALGLAAAVAVLAAVLASITLLPALLSLLGGWIDRVRVPAFLQMRSRPAGATRWDGWGRWVSTHPWTAVGVAAVILVPLILPVFSLTLGQEDIGATPTSTTERQAYDLMAEGFGVGYNGPLLIATELDPPAQPSAGYTKKYDEATSLQKQLERERRSLLAQQAALERQRTRLEARQRTLEREGARLRREAAALTQQRAALERQEAILQQQAAWLRAQAARLAAAARPIVAHLAFLLGRERFVRHLIATTTDPNRLLRLRARLDRLEVREARTRARLAPLISRARVLLADAERLAGQAQSLRAQADALRAQADAVRRRQARLEAQAAELRRQGAALQSQAAALEDRQAQAEAQKRHAEHLKQELTRILTKAGGDPRGTDPRIVRLQDGLAGAADVDLVSPPQLNRAGDAATLNVIARTAPSDPATADLVRALRASTIPAATAEGGIRAFVGGSTASNVDLAAKIASRFALVIATVITLASLLLMLAFRSLLVPVQAAVTNLLCVGAALGILTATFQWGWGLAAIGLDAPGDSVPIASYVPLIMFAVLFGLSMDYEVFLMSRIQAHDTAGGAPEEAVPAGLGASAGVISAAALIMFLVFGSFIINGDPTVKQFGVGLAAAVLLAGTMVVLLAPAILTLFRDRVFWMPRIIERIIPHVPIEGAPTPSPQPSEEETTA
jgi:uncharacterized membrane protein YdfJ with MMPL/SSD domain